MRHQLTVCLSAIVLTFLLASVIAAPRPDTAPPAWDAVRAGRYLEGRLDWWLTWPSAARDHDTACVSCHTVLPYALARPALRKAAPSVVGGAAEQRMFANVATRVNLWRDVEPFYPDQTRGLPKSSESRGTEAVLNALILSTRDADRGVLADDTRQALSNMWALQMRTGPANGGWSWLNFKLEPWEGPASTYFGASLAALAVARAPGGYAAIDNIQPQVTLLKEYLRAGAGTESLYNTLMILWADRELGGVLDEAQRRQIADAAIEKQNPDGGWSMASLAGWQRLDNTTIDAASDGFATAFATLALGESGVAPHTPAMQAARGWLVSHQDPATGAWRAMSVNRLRDPETDRGKFMSDAATGYAVLALTREW